LQKSLCANGSSIVDHGDSISATFSRSTLRARIKFMTSSWKAAKEAFNVILRIIPFLVD